jgi:hypothetical protein
MDAAKGREVIMEWRSGYGRVKMERDYGNEGAEEGESMWVMMND